MSKRKIKSEKDKVPCRSLCEKLPRDLFSDTGYVWWYDAEYPRNRGWCITLRLLLERGRGFDSSKCIPAPTVDELFEKFPAIGTGELRIIPTYKRFVSHWELEALCPSWNSTTHVKGKTFADAVCKLYLSLRNEFKRGKKCIKQLF